MIALLSLLAEVSDDTQPEVRLTSQSRILIVIVAFIFLAVILWFIRNRKLQERYSVVWFVGGLGMVIGAIVPGILTLIAETMGVRDTNVALFSLVLLILLAFAFYFTVVASRQAEEITRLAQRLAMHEARAQPPPEDEEGDEKA